MSDAASGARAAALARFFEELSPERLDALGKVYAPDACFRDPFNEVRGVPAIRVFAAAVASLNELVAGFPTWLLAGRQAPALLPCVCASTANASLAIVQLCPVSLWPQRVS